MTNERTARVRALNDELRVNGRGGLTLVTRGVLQLGTLFATQARAAIARQDDFGPGNDPYGEQDFGTLEFQGRRLFWKIDYYDRARVYGSEDPADPAVTTRVLTIMLADEY